MTQEIVRTVLVVDDSAENREILRLTLEHRGYRVLEAENGLAGTLSAARSQPDLILMDIAMPVMSGWTALATLKAAESTRSIPVIAVSAHVLAREEHGVALSSGFRDYLTKPVSAERLIEAVEAAFAPPAVAASWSAAAVGA